MKYIVAGNYEQFRFYCREHGLKKNEARYISDYWSVRGIRGDRADLVFYGTWNETHTPAEREKLHRLLRELNWAFPEKKDGADGTS